MGKKIKGKEGGKKERERRKYREIEKGVYIEEEKTVGSGPHHGSPWIPATLLSSHCEL